MNLVTMSHCLSFCLVRLRLRTPEGLSTLSLPFLSVEKRETTTEKHDEPQEIIRLSTLMARSNYELSSSPDSTHRQPPRDGSVLLGLG